MVLRRNQGQIHEGALWILDVFALELFFELVLMLILRIWLKLHSAFLNHIAFMESFNHIMRLSAMERHCVGFGWIWSTFATWWTFLSTVHLRSWFLLRWLITNIEKLNRWISSKGMGTPASNSSKLLPSLLVRLRCNQRWLLDRLFCRIDTSLVLLNLIRCQG